MKKNLLIMAGLIVFGMTSAWAQEKVATEVIAEKTTETAKADAKFVEQLQAVIKANCEANETENIEAALKTIHPKSPSFKGTEEVTRQLFEKLDLKYEVKEFHYIGKDDTYAVARVKIRTTKRGETKNFTNNLADFMICFRLDDKEWKVWSQNILEIQLDQ